MKCPNCKCLSTKSIANIFSLPGGTFFVKSVTIFCPECYKITNIKLPPPKKIKKKTEPKTFIFIENL